MQAAVAMRQRTWIDSACCGQLVIGYCQLKSNWADFLPQASNLNAKQSMSYEFVYGLIFVQMHLT